MPEVEPGYYDALSARGRCAAGEFTLCGRVLKPFSFRHSLQMDAWENRLWSGTETPEESDFLVAAVICSSEDFVGQMPPPTKEQVAGCDLVAEWDIWRRYMEACYASRPRIWQSMTSGGGGQYKAPMEEFVITFILRHSAGYSRDWLETAPVALVLWIFEAIAEQIGSRSRIITAADQAQMEADSTPAADRARARREKIAGEIFKRFGTDPRRRIELLRLLDEGKLPKDWRKKPAQRPGKRRAAQKRNGKGRKR